MSSGAVTIVAYATPELIPSFHRALDRVAHERVHIEMVELNVYTDNAPAIALYRKHGFVEEGVLKRYRKLDGRYFDCLAMAKFF